jgi:outer membrane protein assembly factor BamD (BamD/ComL family)
MFNSISWQGYWAFIALTVAVYYLGLFITFRLKDGLLATRNGRTVWQKQSASPITGSEYQEAVEVAAPVLGDDFLYPSPESEEYPVYACVDEVNAYLEEAKRHKSDKAAMIAALGAIVAKYPTIRNSEYRESVTNVIVAQCEHLCFMHLDAEEMDRVWVG